MIEIPIPPSFSADSDLSLGDCFRRNDKDDRDQSSLMPHPSGACDLNLQHMCRSVHHSSRVSVKEYCELNWPSDEDDE